MVDRILWALLLVVPLVAILLLLPFEIHGSQMEVISGRFLILWLLFGCWAGLLAFGERVLVARRHAASHAERVGKLAATVALILFGIGALASLEVFRVRTDAGAFVAVVVALSALVAFRKYRGRAEHLVRGGALYLYSVITSTITSYLIAPEFAWQPLIFFMGTSAMLLAAWYARELPVLLVSQRYPSQRVVRLLHLLIALAPTCVISLTAAHVVPRSYLISIIIIPFFYRTFEALVPSEAGAAPPSRLWHEVLCGGWLFLMILVLLRFL